MEENASSLSVCSKCMSECRCLEGKDKNKNKNPTVVEVSFASLEDALDDLEKDTALEDWHHYWLEQSMKRGDLP